MRPCSYFLMLIFAGVAELAWGQQQEGQEIRLIVRGDDIGSCHAANVACIETYQKGIMTTVELLVPCPWFLEAVQLLNANPGLDVGIHLVLTSEWEKIKWRPVTHAPSLVDSNGYFFPMVWPTKNFPANSCLLEAGWNIDEIERELEAQIKLALNHVPHCSHLTGHMGPSHATLEIEDLVKKLATKYNLAVDLAASRVQGAGGFGGSQTSAKAKEQALVKIPENLPPGTWLFVDHPGLNTPELQTIGHKGYEHVAADRDGDTRAFASKKVKKVIKKRGIKLISYRDLKKI